MVRIISCSPRLVFQPNLHPPFVVVGADHQSVLWEVAPNTSGRRCQHVRIAACIYVQFVSLGACECMGVPAVGLRAAVARFPAPPTHTPHTDTHAHTHTAVGAGTNPQTPARARITGS